MVARGDLGVEVGFERLPRSSELARPFGKLPDHS
jgi:pyruvate kinase